MLVPRAIIFFCSKGLEIEQKTKRMSSDSDVAELRALARACEFETPWSWYVHYQCGSVNYAASYIKVGEFRTVYEFWALFHSLPSVRAVHRGGLRVKDQRVVAYSLFRSHVKPEWEDPINNAGSEWGCRETLDEDLFADLWRDYVLGAIGEKIPHAVGVRAINKSNRQRLIHKIEVWMDCTDTKRTQECRRHLSSLNPSTPRFVHMMHQEKQTQAIEYNQRRGASNGKKRHDIAAGDDADGQ
jgi:hypothetical protein